MRKQFISSLFMVIFLVSCGSTEQISVEDALHTAVAQTRSIDDAVETAVMQTEIAQQGPFLTQTYIMLASISASPSPSQTPELVIGTLNSDANCRSGPHSNFELVTIISEGTSVHVVGQNTDNTQWWQLELSDRTTCWVSGDLLTISGNADNVPEIASQAVPTSFYSPWIGTWTVWQNQCTNNVPACENKFTISFVMPDADTLVGSYITGGCTFIDTLTLSADQTRADGFERTTDCGGSWEIHLVMDPNHNQFRGRWTVVGDASTDGYFCGARNGFSKPDPTRP